MIEINGITFKKINETHVEWLKHNYHLKLTDIEKHLGISNETVYKLLRALNIERTRHWKRYLPNTPEAIADLMNPYMSHVKIADKYGVHETTVGHRRKEMGVTVRRNMSSTRLEDIVQSILEELDFAYVPQKKINQWSIDFYMGFKTCIDVHGQWAHTRPESIERDTRKKQELESLGYSYLVIHECDIDSAKEIISEFMTGFPYR